MENLTIVDRPEKGDFRINPIEGHVLTNEEQAYVDQVHRTLDDVAATDEKEQDRQPPEVLSARKKAREAIVSSLRSLTESDSTVEVARQKAEEVQKKYQAERSSFPDTAGTEKFFITEDDSHFPGYFIAQENFGQTSSEDEKKYVEAVNALLNLMEADANKDKEALEQNIQNEHAEVRQMTAISLRFDVMSVSNGTVSVEQGTAILKDATDNYHKDIARVDAPKLILARRSETERRFNGDFQIQLNKEAKLAPEHSRYVEQVWKVLSQLAEDEKSDKEAGYPASVLATRTNHRREMAEELYKNAEAVSKGRLAASAATDNAPTFRGKYLRNLELVSGTLFKVSISEGKDQGFASGLTIDVERDLLPPNNVASPEKQELYTLILATQSVIKTVCNRIESGDADGLCGRLFGAQRKDTASDRAKILQDEYLRKLAEIGRHGLQGPHTGLAKLALDSLRNEFVAHEGPRIKNSYVCRLGLACGVAAAACLIVYCSIAASYIHGEFWRLHRPFLLAGTGAAIGTWLSFSIREVQLSFDHLGVVEADLLDPAFRVLFVVALTVTACLLFWTGVMNIEIGNLKTTPAALDKAGTIALLIGLFCGLSERTLATSISGRAATFVKGLSG